MKKETLRLSNSINLSERLYDICKSGWMTKRSQNKKRFTPVNYKLRWFELTKYYLSYFDVEGVEVSFFIILVLVFNLLPFILSYLNHFMQALASGPLLLHQNASAFAHHKHSATYVLSLLSKLTDRLF